MEPQRFGSSINPLPLLMATTILTRKLVCSCFENRGEIVWNSVEFGWKAPLKLDGTRTSTGELKPKQDCDKLDKGGNKDNAWGFYSIFNEVSLN